MKTAVKEKANELISTFGKELAPKVVDEILKSLEAELLDLFSSARNCPINHKHTQYWQEVKQEITKQQEQ